MSLSNGSKVRILESFQSIDYVLFGKPLSEMEVCSCDGNTLKEDYISVKGALLSTLIEMFKLTKHSPRVIKKEITPKKLRIMAKESAQIARDNCKKLVSSEKGRDSVKMELRESLMSKKKKINLESLVKRKIREKAFKLALDNLLVARTLTESKKLKVLNDWSGKIVEDAYRVLRDQLVESAVKIIKKCA